MKGDYSRDTFDSRKHYSRVLMQQGRVQMDADWNEQVASLLHYLRTLARDLIGAHGAPADMKAAFKILVVAEREHPDRIADLRIGPGRYYVDGIMCETDQAPDSGMPAYLMSDKELSEQGAIETAYKVDALPQYSGTILPGRGKRDYELAIEARRHPGLSYYRQPDYSRDPANEKLEPPFLVYLDVWERHITAIEDPEIRDVALGDADTAARAKIIWQVKVVSWDDLDLDMDPDRITCDDPVTDRIAAQLRKIAAPTPWGRLEAQAKVEDDDVDNAPCIVSPEAKYRGAENQLYRVEIHRGGKAGGSVGATFKWSRENGSVTFPIRAVAGDTVSLDNLGRDERFGLEVGDWVELVDDASVMRAESLNLLQVVEIDRFELTVRLSGPAPRAIDGDRQKHPLLRRWDHQKGDPQKGGLQIADDGAAYVVEGPTNWLNLEDGVQIRFSGAGNYASGAYWLITARTATGDVQLHYQGKSPEDDQLEHPALHHYAPLAIVSRDLRGAGDNPFLLTDLRRFIRPAAICWPDASPPNS